MKTADMQEYHIREHRESDIGGVLSLFRSSFNKEISEDWFRWKYHRSPWGSRGYVALHGDEVVAFYGGIKLHFSFMGNRLTAYQLCDVMTDPRYRARLVGKTPLIVMLGETLYRENRMDFAFGFPSLRHARLQSLRLGGQGYRLVRSYKKEALRKRAFLRRFRTKEGWEYLKGGDTERFAALNADGTLRLAKDERYIRWRYPENPSKRYGLIAFKRLHLTKGYVVFTIEEGSLNILEVFCGEPGELEDILIAAEAYAADKALKGIRAWFHPSEPLISSVESLGYSGEDGIPLAFKPVNNACGVTPDIFYENYFYRMGDYDAS